MMSKHKFLFVIALLTTLSLMLSSVPQLVSGNTDTIEVTRSVDPTTIFLAGFGMNPEETTITLNVSGYGGTTTSIAPLDVVFAIDSSGSMTWNDPSNLRLTAAKSFVDQLDPSRDTAGVVSWDEGIDFVYGLTDDFASLKSQIDLVDSSGGTNLNAGLQRSIQMLDDTGRAGAIKTIIFLSDGQGSYTPSTSPGSFATLAASRGYTVYTIGLTVSTFPLQDIANTTGGQFFSSPSAENLQDIFDAIFTEIVTSTSPYDVDLIEVTQDYIVDESSFTVMPDSVSTDSFGITTIQWYDIAQYVGNGDSRLSADEFFLVSYTAKSTKSGTDLPVSVFGSAVVSYLDPNGTPMSVNIPQGYIDVYRLVDIDIKPGSYPNSINLKSKGRLPVAILTTADFDATTVDPTTVTFEGASPVHWAYEDVDHDGDTDLILHFKMQELGLTADSTESVLIAETFDGDLLYGSDSVRIVPPKH